MDSVAILPPPIGLSDQRAVIAGTEYGYLPETAVVVKGLEMILVVSLLLE